jgi:hypothetical protein
MNRRNFLGTISVGASAGSLAFALPSQTKTTVLYNDHSVVLDKVRPDPKGSGDLWIRAADLPAVNEFHLKPQGACRADTCIPISKDLKNGEWFNLSGFSRKIHQSVVAESGVWSLGEIPVLRGDYYGSRIAPDFSVPDRKGRTVHLSDFRGKKVLLVTWASW